MRKENWIINGQTETLDIFI